MLALIPTLALLAAGLAPLSPASAADVPTCEGRTATIVGNGHDPVEGTDGPDVIVSNGSSVYAGDGSDLVCMTHVRGPDTAVSDDDASAGFPINPGDDTIVVVSASPAAHLMVFLQGGDDTFLGGPEADFLPRGYAGEPVAHGGDDVVRTGAGDDVVEVGDAPDTPPSVGSDDVDLGAGDDVLRPREGAQAQARSWVGGPGDDTVSFRGRFVRVDVPHHRVTTEAWTFTSWRGFDTYGVGGDSVTFRGSDRGETVFLGSDQRSRVALRGGDDVLLTGSRSRGPVLARGGRGDDLLKGGRGDDRLIGGPGDDRAFGRGGDDVCRAEHRSDCGGR